MTRTTLSRKGPSGLLAAVQCEGRVAVREAFVWAHCNINEAAWLLQIHSLDNRFLTEGSGWGFWSVALASHKSIGAWRLGVIPR